MRRFVIATLCALTAVGFSSCAQQDEESRRTSEAGGTLPWNRPASWEGGGALGSQMQQMQGGSGANF